MPITVTQANQELVVTLRKYYQDNATLDLGWHSLKDLASDERVFQLCHPSIPSTFAPSVIMPIFLTISFGCAVRVMRADRQQGFQ